MKARTTLLGVLLLAAASLALGQASDAEPGADAQRADPQPADPKPTDAQQGGTQSSDAQPQDAQAGAETTASTAEPESGNEGSSETESPEALAARLTKGYSTAVRDGVTFYCRSEAPLGTRLPTRRCYTMEQLYEMERERVDNRHRLERKQIERKTNTG